MLNKVQRFIKPSRYFSSVSLASSNKYVYNVDINNPKKRNAISLADFKNIGKIFSDISASNEKRCVVFTASGNLFSSGIDLSSFDELLSAFSSDDASRNARRLYHIIVDLQKSLLAVSKCSKPVLMGVQGACIGGGINLACHADIRYCIPADLGCMQLFPKLTNNKSRALELILTGRKFFAEEALELGFVSQIFDNKKDMDKYMFAMADEISLKSPVAIDIIKRSLLYSDMHSVEDSLDHLAVLNSAALQGKDFQVALNALMNKKDAKFDDL